MINFIAFTACLLSLVMGWKGHNKLAITILSFLMGGNAIIIATKLIG